MNRAIFKKSGVSSSQLHHDPGHWDTIAHELRYAFVAEKIISLPCLDDNGEVTTIRKLHDLSRKNNNETHPRVSCIDCGGGAGFLWEALNTERRGIYVGHYTNLEYDQKVCDELSERIKTQISTGRAKVVCGSYCGADWKTTADRLLAERGNKRYDVCVSLESLEHLPYLFNGETDEYKSLDEALDFFRYIADYGIFSTPNFSERYGKAEDHTREWRYEELLPRLEARYAKVTPIPIRCVTGHITPEDLREPEMLPYLQRIFEIYPSNPTMHLIAPHFRPDSPKVRNILWLCESPKRD